MTSDFVAEMDTALGDTQYSIHGMFSGKLGRTLHL